MRRLIAAQWAQRRRSMGHYDVSTLAGFAAAWKRSGAVSDLLAYALFRRDLGRPLPGRWVETLLNGLPRLSVAQRRHALGLIAEVSPMVLKERPGNVLGDWREMPSLASSLGADPAPLIARIDTQQGIWRAEFASWAGQQCARGGLCVVGNAASLSGQALGARIDDCGGVVRFNRFGSDPAHRGDMGRRTDVWVVSPGYRGPVPSSVAWAVVSGPDMRYRLQDWRPVLPLLQAGVPVLTVPLAVWRPLVEQLRAPPSAGVLMLAWLKTIQASKGWKGLVTAGIGCGLTAGGQYHLVSTRQAAGTRHNWAAEQQLVASWLVQGLTTLSSRHAGSGSGAMVNG